MIVPNGFGKWWLGNLVTKLGGNWEEYPCRRNIIDYSLMEKNTLMIWQNTAWAEQEGLRRIIEEINTSLYIRNLLGSHYNEWALSLSDQEIREFAYNVQKLYEKTFCSRCLTWVSAANAYELSLAQCHCSFTSVPKKK